MKCFDIFNFFGLFFSFFLFFGFKKQCLTVCTRFFFLYNFQEGSIGHDVVIKPVPAGIINSDADSSSATHHIVYKRKVDPMDQMSDFGEWLKFLYNFFFPFNVFVVDTNMYSNADKLNARILN